LEEPYLLEKIATGDVTWVFQEQRHQSLWDKKFDKSKKSQAKTMTTGFYPKEIL
jgi:hypothetical protein